MAKKTDPGPRLDEALLEMARDGLLRTETADKITMRILGKEGATKPADLSPAEMPSLREHANMSQAVFARFLNVTAVYISSAAPSDLPARRSPCLTS